MSSLTNVKGFFIKSLDAKCDLDLPCSSLVSAYGNVVEVQDVLKFNRKYV